MAASGVNVRRENIGEVYFPKSSSFQNSLERLWRCVRYCMTVAVLGCKSLHSSCSAPSFSFLSLLIHFFPQVFLGSIPPSTLFLRFCLVQNLSQNLLSCVLRQGPFLTLPLVVSGLLGNNASGLCSVLLHFLSPSQLIPGRSPVSRPLPTRIPCSFHAVR